MIFVVTNMSLVTQKTGHLSLLLYKNRNMLRKNEDRSLLFHMHILVILLFSEQKDHCHYCMQCATICCFILSSRDYILVFVSLLWQYNKQKYQKGATKYPKTPVKICYFFLSEFMQHKILNLFSKPLHGPIIFCLHNHQ